MTERVSPTDVAPVEIRDPQVLVLLDALTSELSGGGYTANQTFGYSAAKLECAGVHLVGARVAGQLVGIGGVELQDDGIAELKRFFVMSEHRGAGVADALMAALLGHATAHGMNLLRLETGDKQRAAVAFYRRHGFAETQRFGPYIYSETSICMQRSLLSRDDR